MRWSSSRRMDIILGNTVSYDLATQLFESPVRTLTSIDPCANDQSNMDTFLVNLLYNDILTIVENCTQLRVLVYLISNTLYLQLQPICMLHLSCYLAAYEWLLLLGILLFWWIRLNRNYSYYIEKLPQLCLYYFLISHGLLYILQLCHYSNNFLI